MLFRLFPLISICALLSAETAYQKPPKEILDVLNAPAIPTASLSPAKSHVLLLTPRVYPTIAELAAPMHRLAGYRINPANDGRHTVPVAHTAITVKEIATGKETPLALPPNARLTGLEWSPDGRRFAALNYTPSAVELWVGSIHPASIRKIAGLRVNDTTSGAIEWIGGSTDVLVRTVPPARGSAPTPPAAPAGPNVQESLGGAAPIWTIQDLLKNPYDEKLFDHYFTSQLAIVNVSTGAIAKTGTPAIFDSIQPAPDGKHILVSRIRKPYSYLHDAGSFPREFEVWDRAGKLVHKVFSAPLEDKTPIDGVPTGPRRFSWRATDAATLLWWEALDGGDPKNKVPFRDRLMMHRAPFNTAPVEVMKVEQRGTAIWHAEGGVAFVFDLDRDTRTLRARRIYLDDLSSPPVTVWSRNLRERYKNPGNPVFTRLPNGATVMQTSGDYIFLRGDGATPQGDRPFLDRMNIKTLQTERLFRAGEKGYESVAGLLDDSGERFLTSYESPNEPPNLFIRTRGSEQRRQLTSFADPTPQLRSIQRKLVTYKRDDGVSLSFTLFLPPGYKEGTRLPTILYAYPLEFTDTDTAGQIGGSTQRFVQMRGAAHLFLLLAGYAILNDATIPIVGSPETVNNTYIEQLTASARAAIDKAVELGVTDRNRVGVTGHSYGGFMTANLLAHTDFFRAGVARSGAYNRTLTPFGFQAERRTYWEAREVYTKMSPFTYADKIKEPILLIHGEADNNSGTFPIQSDRLYQAIRGNGGTVRLVMLPHEAHGYMARESIEHVLYETAAWFDKYVKEAAALSTSR